MKIKYYLRGLGTGIIFTAIVLMIIYSYRTTDSKTIDRARELGMVMPEETSKQTLTGDDNKTDNDSTGEKHLADNATSNNTQEETSENFDNKEDDTTEPSTDEPDTKDTSTDEPTSEKQTPDGREITFTVSDGMYSEAVSQRLFELGVIDDAAGFNKYLGQNGLAGTIRTGTYTLTTGMTYEDVAEIIAN